VFFVQAFVPLVLKILTQSSPRFSRRIQGKMIVDWRFEVIQNVKEENQQNRQLRPFAAEFAWRRN